MKDYSGYNKCNNCGKYNMPDEDCRYVRNEFTRYDFSMQCDGVMSMDVDPFAEEIHGDSSLYWNCQGGRYDSAQEI